MHQLNHEQDTFIFRRSGHVGQEILDGHGNIICWTTSEWLAALIVHLLNREISLTDK